MGFPLKSLDLLPAASTWRRKKKLENTYLTGTSIFLAVIKGQKGGKILFLNKIKTEFS